MPESIKKYPLIVLYGLISAGKTTISRHIVKKLPNYVRYNTDEVRRTLGKDKWDPKDTPAVNNYLYAEMRKSFASGKGVIIDSANKTRKAREKLYNIAREFKVPIIVLECFCRHEIALERLKNRPVGSKDHGFTNDPKVYYDFIKLVESPENDFQEGSNSDVSYVKINTEDHSFSIVRLSSASAEAEYIKEIEQIIPMIRDEIFKS